MDKYKDMTLEQLKELLKERGFRTSGRKKELITRLQALDDIGARPKEQPLPEFKMETPAPEHYLDINADTVVPILPMSRIVIYYSNYSKEFEEKYTILYKERYVRFIRMAKHQGATYFSASVWAEMKKSVSYHVDIHVDDHSVIAEAQCECSAGQGPSAHCKHIGTVLYGIHQFHTNRTLLTETTCTQKLQMFHKAKADRGSPVKMAALQSQRGHKYSYDPRLPSDRKMPSYSDHFRNTVLGYQGEGRRMPILQLYSPANPYALGDHEYVTDQETYFLTTSLLKVISDEERAAIELKTRSQSSSKIWHHERSIRLTSSEFGVICKAHDPKNLAVKMIEAKEFSTKATKHGKLYEPVALEKYCEAMNVSVEPCGLFISLTHPFLAASPDGILNDTTCVEIKCPYSVREECINESTIPYLTLNSSGQLTLKTNHNYYYQIQGQLHCSNRDFCHLCIFTFKDFKIIVVKKDQTFIDDMISMLNTFFNEHFKPLLLERLVYKDYKKHFC